MNDDELTNIATKLWPIIENGNCIAWLGSGLSNVANFPGWGNLLDQLCHACGVDPLIETEKGSAEKLIDKAEECKLADSILYENTLATTFGRRIIDTRLAFTLLMKLPFKGYITTNFDALLSTAGATHENHNLHAYPDLPIEILGGDTKPIFYIHGLARHDGQQNGANLVLAKSDFDIAYRNFGIVTSFLTQLFTYNDILFISCRLGEPEIQNIFERVHKIHIQIKQADGRFNQPQRNIILPIRQLTEDDAGVKKVKRDIIREKKEKDQFSAIGINVMRYEPLDEKHGEIEQILEYLCNLADLQVIPTLRIGPGNGGI